MTPFLGFLACVSSETSLTATTSAGTWQIEVASAPDGRGITDLELIVTPVTGTLVEFVASMPDMGHASDGTVTEVGEGLFSVNVNFTMPGVWVLDGTVTGPDGEETFRMDMEVP